MSLTIPSFAVEVLGRRREQLCENELDAVFVTREGTWGSAHSLRRARRDIRSQADLEWVVLHTFRTTVATMIEREFGAARAVTGDSGRRAGVITDLGDEPDDHTRAAAKVAPARQRKTIGEGVRIVRRDPPVSVSTSSPEPPAR